MDFHRLRLLTFGRSSKSRSAAKVPSRPQSNRNETLKGKSSSDKTITPHEDEGLFKHKSAAQYRTTICNRVETERIPIHRRSKSESPPNFSFTKIMENLGHRKTTSLSDIKKRFTKCSRLCTQRIRQTLQMFRPKSDSKNNINGEVKEIETILSAPNLTARSKCPLPSKECTASSSNRFGSFQKNVRLYDLHSCLKIKKNKNKKSSGKLRSLRRRKSSVDYDKSVPASLKGSSSRNKLRSESVPAWHYNLVNFPSTSKRKQSKHNMRLYQKHSKIEDNKYKPPSTVDKPVSIPSLDIPAALTQDTCQSSCTLNNTKILKPTPKLVAQSECKINNDKNSLQARNKIKPLMVYSAARAFTKVQDSYPLFVKNERRSKHILKCIVLFIIMIAWSPCIIAVWFSWCLSYPFRPRDVCPNEDECKSGDDSGTNKPKLNKVLLYLCCGWTQIICNGMTTSDSQYEMKDSRYNLNPHYVLSRALLKLNESITRRPHSNKKCVLVYKNGKGWKVKSHNGSKRSRFSHNVQSMIYTAQPGGENDTLVNNYERSSSLPHTRKGFSELYSDQPHLKSRFNREKRGSKEYSKHRDKINPKMREQRNGDVLICAPDVPTYNKCPKCTDIPCKRCKRRYYESEKQTTWDFEPKRRFRGREPLTCNLGYSFKRSRNVDPERKINNCQECMDVKINDPKTTKTISNIPCKRCKAVSCKCRETLSVVELQRSANNCQSCIENVQKHSKTTDDVSVPYKRHTSRCEKQAPLDVTPKRSYSAVDLRRTSEPYGRANMNSKRRINQNKKPIRHHKRPYGFTAQQCEVTCPGPRPLKVQHKHNRERRGDEGTQPVGGEKCCTSVAVVTSQTNLDCGCPKPRSPLDYKKYIRNLLFSIQQWLKRQFSCIANRTRESDRDAWEEKIKCDKLYMRSLRKKPGAKFFRNCPSLYPYFLLCRQTCVNMCDQYLLCLAACIYSPLLVCCYLTGVLCCRICNL